MMSKTIFEPTVYFQIKTIQETSNIAGAGYGLFSLEEVSAGAFLGMDFPRMQWIKSAQEIRDLPEEERKYCWRLVSDLCFHQPEKEKNMVPMDFLNHSANPNVLWHLGFYFSRKKINVGDELFVDYQHLMDPLWNSPFKDSVTNQPFNGSEWRKALLNSTRQLVQLLEEKKE